MDDGAAAVAAAHRDQALGLQDSQRFPQRHQADVELLDEHLLARQQVTVGQFAVDDLTAQLVGYDLGDPAAPTTGDGPRGRFPVLSLSSSNVNSDRLATWVYGSLSDKSY